MSSFLIPRRHALRWLAASAVAIPTAVRLTSLVRAESPAEAAQRKRRVAERRASTHILCHRGAAEFAHENTLEAYRAALELGADGNEVDIRATRDGVLVAFHDDMLDRLLVAYRDVADLTWDELRRAPFREPGPWGAACRIPTLAEVFQLHRDLSGLLHLDIKRPGLDAAIGRLLDEYDLWEHVIHCHRDHGGELLRNPRLRLLRYKGNLYQERGEMFRPAIRELLAKPGDGVIVDDPRGVILELGRPLGTLSRTPVAAPQPPIATSVATPRRELDAVVRELTDDADWNRPPVAAADRAASAERILKRARAADELATYDALPNSALAALARRVEQRSLHPDWMFHGLDGALALRTLAKFRWPPLAELVRRVVWRDDPALESVANPEFKTPRSWTDFRVKMIAFPALRLAQDPAGVAVCRDYLALSDEELRTLGPDMLDDATRAQFSLRPTSETARELLTHSRQTVRGRAILDCLARADSDWARSTLTEHAPDALRWITLPAAPKTPRG